MLKNRSLLNLSIAVVGLACVTPALHASKFIPVAVPERIKGADRVVVATVGAATPTWETNELGDQIIVTHVTLTVEEALKGQALKSLTLDMDGGTLDGVKLEVSSLPVLEAGDRAVFFLERGKGGAFRPHLKGQGIVKLRPDGTIKNSSLTLNDIRQMAAAQAGR